MRRRWSGRTLLVAALVAATAACGGDDGGGASSKAEWQDEHGDLVAAFGRDLEHANTTIQQGEKQATISACTQLADDAKEMRSEVFPVPNPDVDTRLRAAVDTALKASENCIQGGRNVEGARQVEAAMRELNDARTAFAEAQAAIAAWR